MNRLATKPLGFCLVVLAAWLALAGGLAAANGAPGESDQSGEAPTRSTRSLLDFIRAGKIVGYVILALSFVGTGLVIDAFVRIRRDKLLPPGVAQEAGKLAREGKFSEILTLSQANDSMLSRILRGALPQGSLGMEAIREAMAENGVREVTRLQQRAGYIGFIAAVAPMLGLLGTVTGMIDSFGVLGRAKESPPAHELAVGVSEALVTTCMGLIVAVPLMFFHSLFRDRITRIAQEASGHCDRLLRSMTAAIAAHTPARAAPAPAPAPPPGVPPPAPPA